MDKISAQTVDHFNIHQGDELEQIINLDRFLFHSQILQQIRIGVSAHIIIGHAADTDGKAVFQLAAEHFLYSLS